MSRLEELRIKNPGIRFYSVKDREFARYGCIVEHDFSGIAEMAKKLPFLVEGSKYEASIGAFEIHPSAEVAKEELYGELDIQIGNCWGYNSYLNALEWHKNSEINVAATDLVLILAKLDDIEDGKLDSAKAVAFLVEEGEAVEIYADTLHYCPCQVSPTGFNCVVILPKGTNRPLTNKPEDPLIFRKNKWIFCHEDNKELIAKGVVPAIYGENYRINY